MDQSNEPREPKPGNSKLAAREDQPRSHPKFLLLLGFAALASNPVLFAGREPILFLGLPTWLWWSIGWTVVLSALTAYGLLRYWREPEDGSN